MKYTKEQIFEIAKNALSDWPGDLPMLHDAEGRSFFYLPQLLLGGVIRDEKLELKELSFIEMTKLIGEVSPALDVADREAWIESIMAHRDFTC